MPGDNPRLLEDLLFEESMLFIPRTRMPIQLYSKIEHMFFM